MCKRIIVSFLILLTSIYSAQSAQIPVSFNLDSRIKRFSYEENNVYELRLFLKSVLSIQFAEGESVQSIVVGDSESWEIVRLKRGNVVSVKPVIEDALTNMTIYTDRYVYSFELLALGEISVGSNPRSRQAFRISFSYPEDDAEDEEEIKPAFVGGPINYNYRVAGRAKFRPIEVRDDQYRTYFVLPSGAPRPAIFKVGRRGTEKLVNSRTDGQRIIVDGVSDYWVMRIGNEYVCVARGELKNTSPPPAAPANQSKQPTDLKVAALPETPPVRPAPDDDEQTK